MSEVDDLTLKEYDWLMTAQQLRAVDENYHIFLQSWTNQQAKATKGKGKNIKSAYKSFNDFFDYEKQRQKVLGEKREETERGRTLKAMISQYNKTERR